MTQQVKTIAPDLLQKGLLTRYGECPVCGSPERIPRLLPFKADRYIGAGARWLGISEQMLFDSLEGQECLRCGALYFDPWLSLRFQKHLYEIVYPQHNLGWETFWSAIRNPSGLFREADLYRSLNEQIPNLKTYGELGCPFSGLLPYLSLKEYQYRSRRFWDYPGSYMLNASIGQHPQVKGNLLNFERMGRFMAQSFNRIQLLRAFPWRRLLKRSLIRLRRAQGVEHPGINCYYINHGSSTLWGNNCKSLGVDCHTALQNVCGVQSMNFEDIETEKIHFDLVAIFNSLDHYKNPVKLLCRIFEFTDHIYVEGHHSREGGGKQHFYFLEEDTIRALPQILPVAEAVLDFKGRAAEHCYSILLRKRTEPPFRNTPSQSLDIR